MADETRLERRLEGVLARAKTVRGAGIVIAAVSTSITLVAGSMMTVADHDNFPSIGSGLWWAVQTVTTSATATTSRRQFPVGSSPRSSCWPVSGS